MTWGKFCILNLTVWDLVSWAKFLGNSWVITGMLFIVLQEQVDSGQLFNVKRPFLDIKPALHLLEVLSESHLSEKPVV